MAMTITRRRFVHASVALAGLATVVPIGSVLAAEENNKWVSGEGTPDTVMGPFYPLLSKPANPGTDLTMVKGGTAHAQGQLLYLMGQVLDVKGTPIKGVQVEIWQANAAGRYRFKTIKPGSYPVTRGWVRPPHIHYELTGRKDKHVTQIWFPDEPLNAQDRLFDRLSPAARQKLTCKIEAPAGSMEPDSKVALFNIVLTNG